MKHIFAHNDAARVESLCSRYNIDIDLEDFMEEEALRRLQYDIFQAVYLAAFKSRLQQIDSKGELDRKLDVIYEAVEESFHFNYACSCFDTNPELICNAAGIKGKRKRGFIAHALDV